MSAAEKAQVLDRVGVSTMPTRQVLRELGVPKSTYYRWRTRTRSPDTAGTTTPVKQRVPWNRLTEDEEHTILRVARGSPEWSSRQVAAWITDHEDVSVSEATVYRILRREGLIRRLETADPAGKEYTRKTTGPHQLWATDASYFRVTHRGYYYMVTVMDDFSRFIIAWELKIDMTAASFIDVVQEAVDATGMTDVPIECRTKLLSDNGPGYISRAFREYLKLVGIRHILAAPFHPQTNGKLERYHQTLKRGVNQVPYDVPADLEAAIGKFVSYYNFHRYHKALADVTPADMLAGKRDEILSRRREVKARTIQHRRLRNQTLREQRAPAGSLS
jgi:transposase InsO family protein